CYHFLAFTWWPMNRQDARFIPCVKFMIFNVCYHFLVFTWWPSNRQDVRFISC
ncbi:hypothetical protein NDU88_007229, partial [Pleurodeles waltl]